MKLMIAVLGIIALAIIGMAGAEDFINQVGGTPLIKDLGNLSMEEINAIFSGDGAWLDSQNTPSIDAFRKFNEADGKPLVEPVKMAYVGSAWRAKQAEQPVEPIIPDGVIA